MIEALWGNNAVLSHYVPAFVFGLLSPPIVGIHLYHIHQSTHTPLNNKLTGAHSIVFFSPFNFTLSSTAAPTSSSGCGLVAMAAERSVAVLH